ncbi:potassium/proton antiporter [Alsobacter sp. SYSU M60028]|uniref:Potassium/proton antiporter n=1 Tax=Alsobacter ponti TaxID=2962936 RepID=A0ABT1LKF0_9HYPH|nr:potassium/proton antiporter [Alsobacter ponti]MCP8940728.1 potassium/proton antiporter [Alsobacter ponti]
MSALFTAHASLLFGSALALVGIMSSLLASRFGVPILLVFLGVGILAGENGLGVHFENYQLTYMVGSAALAIILFDGGLRTRMATVRAVLAPAGALASAGVVITAGLTGVVAAVLLRLGWVEGLLVGAIVASTDAAVVFFLLRTGGLQLRRRVGGVLEVESGANDPFAVLLTVMLVTVLSGASFAPGALVLRVLEEGSLGLIIGLAGGFGLVGLINRVSLPSGLHPAFVVTAALVIFALTQTLGASGFLAAYVAGLVFGNRPVRAYGAVISFHDTATWLCQIVLFTLLGLLVTPSHVMPLVLPAVAVAAFLIAIGRPVAVFACLTPFRYSRAEMAFVSWVGLRGGVSIFLATIPLLVGLPRGELFFNVAFVVVVVSLIVQGWTISFAARRAGVALRDPAPEVKRIDIDLPGQLHEELVGYPVRDPSPATRHRALPSWVKPVLVVRGGKVLDPMEAGNLRPGDYGYFLAPTPRIPRLDRFFAVDGTVSDRDTIPEFPFDASLTAGAVADLYGLTIDEGERAMSIADLFADRLDGAPQEGDRLDFGDAMLVAHGVVADRVHLAGLLLEATAEDEEPPPATWSEAAGRRARKQWRRLRQRARRPAA